MDYVRRHFPSHYNILPKGFQKEIEQKMEVKDGSDQSYSYRKGSGSRTPSTKAPKCTSTGERQCEDGSCIARVELCPEEQLMNQNTILIMIVVGLAVVIFLVILYCFQQRQRRASQALGTETGLSEDCDNASLYAPPPSYEDVMSSNLYLPTEEHRRLQMLSTAEESLTPPPNYDTALILLAQSQDSALNKPRRPSSVFRRSVSMENINGDENQIRCSMSQNSENRNSKKDKRKTIFRYSGHFKRTSLSRGSNPSSPRTFQSALPPYSPPIYPVTPPPPITPTPPPPITPTPTSGHPQFITQEAGHRLSQTTPIQESPNEDDVIA